MDFLNHFFHKLPDKEVTGGFQWLNGIFLTCISRNYLKNVSLILALTSSWQASEVHIPVRRFGKICYFCHRCMINETIKYTFCYEKNNNHFDARVVGAAVCGNSLCAA